MNSPSPRLPVIGTAMLVLIIAQLATLYLGLDAAQLFAIACIFFIPIIAWRSLKLREIYLIGISALVALAAIATSPQWLAWSVDGLSRSSYLASFILLMALLREGAIHSKSVVKLGRFLTLQPPQRRFLAVFSGSHMLSVMINLGALSLLAPIIQRGVRAELEPGAPLDEIAQIRERRQLCAALRGFSWFLVWAPTAVTQAVMPTLMSGVQALRLMALGLVLALIMMMLGWAEDWIRWRATGRRIRAQGLITSSDKQVFPARAARNFALVCAMLFVCSLAFSKLADVTIVTGVMLAAPLVVIVWLVVQQEPGHRQQGTRDRFSTISFSAMPGYVREMVFISCAGFVGTVGAQLVPVAELTDAIGLQSLPPWLVLWGMSVIVWVFGQVGLSPITMAVFLGSVVAQVPSLPVDITHAALAIAAGTAICTSGAPFSAGALMLSRATGYSPMTLTWRWNGPFTFVTMIVLALVYAALEAGWV